MTSNVLFFGLGSIGKRHARLLKESFDHRLLAFRTNKGQETNDLGVDEVTSWSEVDAARHDVAFITNPTRMHIDFAIECARRKMHLFIEKPIDCKGDRLEELLSIVKENDLTAYVAYPLRFHPVIGELKELLKSRRVLHSIIVCRSYLPAWRPHQNHLLSYSSHKAMGGGVLLDLSHEIDYATYLFGKICDIAGNIGRASDVTVDSEDYADLLIGFDNSRCNIHLDYFSPKTERYVDIVTTEDNIRADLVANTVSITKNGDMTSKKFGFVGDDMYRSQLKYFFDNIKNQNLMNNLLDASAMFTKVLKFRGEL